MIQADYVTILTFETIYTDSRIRRRKSKELFLKKKQIMNYSPNEMSSDYTI